MSDDIAIRVENLGKRYVIGRETTRAKSLAGRVRQTLASPFSWLSAQLREPAEDEILWALRDVSFEVKRGEVLGVIGRNGAGKSTLLKILSRITEPTIGHAEIHGRVGSLLEVGTGMHPELTGRENIYLNGTILGMKKAEIDGKFDEIVDFSGIERFLDTPVKRYSSGMRVRLGFAIAAHLEPEILIVDEVLAVGDAEFQKRCLGKMKDVAGHGRTVLFVSHNMAAVRSLCSRSLLLGAGSILDDAPTSECVSRYLRSGTEQGQLPLADRTDREGDGAIRFDDVSLINAHGDEVSELVAGESRVSIRVSHTGWRNPPMSLRILIGIYNSDGQCMSFLDSSTSCTQVDFSRKGQVECQLSDEFCLAPGGYSVNLCLLSEDKHDYIQSAFHFKVEPGDFYGKGRPIIGNEMCLVKRTWIVKST